MVEDFPQNNLEQEIAELSKEIEEKRNLLEKESGIIDDKKIVHKVISDRIHIDDSSTPLTKKIQKDDTGSYLDVLDESTGQKINELVGVIDSGGIQKAIDSAKNESPLILDAFHDAIVDRLYKDLQEKGFLQ